MISSSFVLSCYQFSVSKNKQEKTGTFCITTSILYLVFFVAHDFSFFDYMRFPSNVEKIFFYQDVNTYAVPGQNLVYEFAAGQDF